MGDGPTNASAAPVASEAGAGPGPGGSPSHPLQGAGRGAAPVEALGVAAHLRDAVLVVGRGGRILGANAAAVAAYGHDRAALLRMDVRDLRAPETTGSVEAQMARAEGEGLLFETVHRRADGSTVPVEVSSVGAELAGERVLVSVVRDITERKRAERALAEGAARLELALEAGGMGAWEVDLATGARFRDGRLLGLCGLPPDTPADRGEAFDALIHPSDRPAREAALRRALAGDGEYRCEFRIRRADTGEERWLAARGRALRGPDGRPERLVGVNFDVTERRAAEQALREGGERLRLAIGAARMATWEYDARTGIATRSGHLVPDAPGLPRERFALSAWLARTHPDDRGRLERAFAEAAAGRLERFGVEYRQRAAEGTGRAWMWIGTHGAVAERDPATGGVLRLAGVAFDVTERREAEERQRLLMREVDHRARNALAVVQAALRLTPRDDARAYAAAVEGRVRALARAHALLAGGRWSGADLRALAEGELAAFLVPAEAAAGGGAAPPRVAMAGPAVRLGAEAAQSLSMALHELATNAVKHGALSAPGGVVRLSWEADRREGMLRLRWSEEGGPRAGAPPTRRGFGSRVIEATVRGQLGGRVERRWDTGGLRCELAVPLGRALAHEGAS